MVCQTKKTEQSIESTRNSEENMPEVVVLQDLYNIVSDFETNKCSTVNNTLQNRLQAQQPQLRNDVASHSCVSSAEQTNEPSAVLVLAFLAENCVCRMARATSKESVDLATEASKRSEYLGLADIREYESNHMLTAVHDGSSRILHTKQLTSLLEKRKVIHVRTVVITHAKMGRTFVITHARIGQTVLITQAK